MKIAIASGKGGTGKTTIAVSMALSLAADHNVWLQDCDVEAPNAHLFLHPVIEASQPAVIRIPEIDKDLCTACGVCVQVCQFHALAKIGKSIMVFDQLCHGCGSCTWNCPVGAITEIPHSIGVIEWGMTAEGIHFSHGKLTLSEPMATPIIRQLKRLHTYRHDDVVLYDCPPGASCSAVESLRGADFALLVTEPTPFGLHDLKQILGIVDEMHIPAAAVINRDGIGDAEVEEFLAQHSIPVLMRVPYDRRLAEGLAAGEPLIQVLPQYEQLCRDLFAQIRQQLQEGQNDHDD